jgi:pantoate kinase
VSVAVNGDAGYPADTTRKAVELLLEGARQPPQLVELVQTVEVPVGAGFGSSSASALSAVMAVAAALKLPLSKEEVASFAHQADILRHTGLGTVSSTYRHSGAGVLVRAGGPGIAKLKTVKVPAGMRVVTACLPRKLRPNVLASTRMRGKVNRLGEAALEHASDLKLKSLLEAGRTFAEGLGLMTRAVEHLVEVSMEEGAVGASQNMIGNSMHAVVRHEDLESVASALTTASRAAKLDFFQIGGRKARILRE